MCIEKALQSRIEDLCREAGMSVTLDSISGDTTILEIEQLCDKLHITLADFFVNDTFR